MEYNIPKETIDNLNRISTAINNAAKEMEKAQIVMDKLGWAKPKWWEFWKWDWSLFDRPPGCYQPTIDNLTTPPRGNKK